MSSYTISCIGFDAPQQDSIAAILALAGSALNDVWRFSDQFESDVVFINMNADNGTRNLSERRMLIQDYRIVLVAASCNESMQEFWFLNKKPTAPPSLKETVILLNQVAVCLSQAQQATAEKPVSEIQDDGNFILSDSGVVLAQTPEIVHEAPLPEAQDVKDGIAGVVVPLSQAQDVAEDIAALDAQYTQDDEDHIANDNDVRQFLNPPKATRKVLPKNYLFGTILQAESDNNCRIVKLKQLPPLYISPQEKAYYFAGTDAELLYFYSASPKLFRIQSSAKLELKKAEKSTALLTKKPLSVLKANAILYASQGKLLEEHSPEWEVKLMHLPNYQEVPILEKYKDIADYMFECETNLFSVAEALNTPLSDVFDFYNIGYLFGYIEVCQKETVAKEVVERKNDKTLGYYLKSLFKKTYKTT